MCTVYHPPQLSVMEFLQDFTSYWENTTTSTCEHIFMGDFYIRVDSDEDSNTTLFKDCLESLNLTCKVDFSTHKHGQTLDLVILDNASSLISMVNQGSFISDHSLIYMELMVSRELVEPKMKMCRRLSKVDHEALGLKLRESVDIILCNTVGIDVNMLVYKYEVEIKGVLDELSPMVKVKQKTKTPFPWMTENIKREIALRRSKEQKWKASKSEYDYQDFSYQRSIVKGVIKQAKKEYFHDFFGEIRGDYKEVFRVVKKLPFNEKESPFLELESCPKIPEYIESSYQTNRQFENFVVLTEMDVRKLMNESGTKSCELDPILTHLLKQHLDALIPLVTKIVNITLQTGQFPNTLQQ